MKRRTFIKGGIHPAPNKITAGMPITTLALPREAYVPLSQHIGAPAECIVSKGEHVTRGQKIGAVKGMVSAAVHTPISGTVTAIGRVTGPNGYPMPAVTICASEEDHITDEASRSMATESHPWENLEVDDLRKMILEAGVVGMGGATFPTHVKLSPPPGAKPEILIINGCECEPYLTCDDALLRTKPAEVVEGTMIIMKAARISKAIIAVEDNKPEAIAALKASVKPESGVTVMALRTKYPQGGEKQLVEAVTGRRIPAGALPVAVGAIVQNVATAHAVFDAVVLHKPVTERVLTVTGDTSPRGNYLVAIGTPIHDIGFSVSDGDKVILGGPMMGRTAINIDTPVTKGTSGVLVLKDSRRQEPQPCVSCGACVNVCPMGLEPYLLAIYGRRAMMAEAEAAAVTDCIECGSCSFSCPSWRPLLDYIRQAKATVIADLKARASQSATRKE